MRLKQKKAEDKAAADAAASGKKWKPTLIFQLKLKLFKTSHQAALNTFLRQRIHTLDLNKMYYVYKENKMQTKHRLTSLQPKYQLTIQNQKAYWKSLLTASFEVKCASVKKENKNLCNGS